MKTTKKMSKLEKMQQERLGATFVNRFGSVYYVVEYNSNKDVIVEFLDSGYQVHSTWQHVKNGEVKSPYDKSVYGHGYLGTLEDGSVPSTQEFSEKSNRLVDNREYRLWKGMLRRVFSGEYPTYANVTIAEEWLCFSTFINDIKSLENYNLWLENDGYALDKDVLQVGVENKVYSPSTTHFITISENSKEVNNRKKQQNESLNK